MIYPVYIPVDHGKGGVVELLIGYGIVAFVLLVAWWLVFGGGLDKIYRWFGGGR